MFFMKVARINKYGILFVDLFLSTFENRIDAKGRLSVPAPYRTVLDRSRSPLYLYKSLTLSCLEGCGPERITQIVNAIEELDSLSKEAEILQIMLSSAQEMRLDSEGRMMLPAEFVSYANLNSFALFSGIGRSFQIWQPAAFRDRETDGRVRAKRDGMPSLRLRPRINPIEGAG